MPAARLRGEARNDPSSPLRVGQGEGLHVSLPVARTAVGDDVPAPARPRPGASVLVGPGLVSVETTAASSETSPPSPVVAVCRRGGDGMVVRTAHEEADKERVRRRPTRKSTAVAVELPSRGDGARPTAPGRIDDAGHSRPMRSDGRDAARCLRKDLDPSGSTSAGDRLAIAGDPSTAPAEAEARARLLHPRTECSDLREMAAETRTGRGHLLAGLIPSAAGTGRTAAAAEVAPVAAPVVEAAAARVVREGCVQEAGAVRNEVAAAAAMDPEDLVGRSTLCSFRRRARAAAMAALRRGSRAAGSRTVDDRPPMPCNALACRPCSCGSAVRASASGAARASSSAAGPAGPSGPERLRHSLLASTRVRSEGHVGRHSRQRAPWDTQRLVALVGRRQTLVATLS